MCASVCTCNLIYFFIVPGHREHGNKDDQYVPINPIWYVPHIWYTLYRSLNANTSIFKNIGESFILRKADRELPGGTNI